MSDDSKILTLAARHILERDFSVASTGYEDDGDGGWTFSEASVASRKHKKEEYIEVPESVKLESQTGRIWWLQNHRGASALAHHIAHAIMEGKLTHKDLKQLKAFFKTHKKEPGHEAGSGALFPSDARITYSMLGGKPMADFLLTQ